MVALTPGDTSAFASLTKWADGNVSAYHRLQSLSRDGNFFILIDGEAVDWEYAFKRSLIGYQGSGETRTLEITSPHTHELFRAHFRCDWSPASARSGGSEWPELCRVEKVSDLP